MSRNTAAPAADDSIRIVFALLDVGALPQLNRVLAEHNVGSINVEPNAHSDGNAETDIMSIVCPSAIEADRVRSTIGPLCKYVQVQFAGSVDVSPADVASSRPDYDLPWFPRSVHDMDAAVRQVFTVGVELNADHPGFSDEQYRARRMTITDLTTDYRMGIPIPRVRYTEAEVRTWNTCLSSLLELYPKYACAEYNTIRQDMFTECGYRLDNVPQLEDISNYMHQRTGFRIRPVAGLLSPRAFLAGFAFKVYHATQYMRHHSRPFYTPEPDVCHELLGHLPLFANVQFADFAHQIGLASLGAPDAYTDRLATCLWFTVEFGLCWENGELRAFGGGLLSSVDELMHALSDVPEVRDFEPSVTGVQAYPITEFQPVYFVTRSIERAKEQIIEYAKCIPRPFTVRLDETTGRVVIEDKAMVAD